jgi:hypothetical protein
VSRLDRLLQPPLNVPTKVARVKVVDAAVHEAKTVRRTDDRFAVDIENRPAMDGNAGKIAAEPFPGVGEFRFNCCEDDVHQDPLN